MKVTCKLQNFDLLVANLSSNVDGTVSSNNFIFPSSLVLIFQLANRLQMLISVLFPFSSSVSKGEINVPPLAERLATVWLKLQDMESSHALSYQWSGSAANKHLLLALGIDSRNIVSQWI